MAQGLRPHYHQYFEYNIQTRYDKEQHCIKKKITYMCMICGKLHNEVYDCYEPPPKSKNKALERNKKKYG